MPTPHLREITLDECEALERLRRLERRVRQPDFLDVSPARSATLARDADLLGIGTGSVGGVAACSAARLAPRSFTLVDPARVKPESVRTHATFTAADIGQPKALVIGRRLKAASPGTRVLVFDGSFEELPVGIAAHAGFWLLASDNQRCEIRVAAAALELSRPLVQGSVHGATLVAQVRSLAGDPLGAGPCLACLYSEAEWEMADRGTLFSCTGPAEAERASAPSQVPTRSVAPLCATAGSLMALELTRRLLGIGDPGESCLLELCGYNFAAHRTPLRRRPDCPLEHRPARLLPEQQPLGRFSPRQLLEHTGNADAPLHRISLSLPRQRYAKLSACGCPTHEVLERFVSQHGPTGRCPRCQQQRAAHPFHAADEVSFAALGARLDCSLASLGAPAPASARVRGERGTSLVYRALPETGIPQELSR